jgi:hypothetical protein
MSKDGYYKWDGLDTDGWPHFEPVRFFEIKGVETQEKYLKTKAIQYLKKC